MCVDFSCSWVNAVVWATWLWFQGAHVSRDELPESLPEWVSELSFLCDRGLPHALAALGTARPWQMLCALAELALCSSGLALHARLPSSEVELLDINSSTTGSVNDCFYAASLVNWPT